MGVSAGLQLHLGEEGLSKEVDLLSFTVDEQGE